MWLPSCEKTSVLIPLARHSSWRVSPMMRGPSASTVVRWKERLTPGIMLNQMIPEIPVRTALSGHGRFCSLAVSFRVFTYQDMD